MKAHCTCGVLAKAIRVPEEDERVTDDAVRLVARGFRPIREPRTKEPGDAEPLHQSANECGIRFVVLHGEFAPRWPRVHQAGIDVEVERGRQEGIICSPLPDERLDDVQLAHVPEDARVDAVFHHGQRIAHDQLIRRQSAVALARQGSGNDAAKTTYLTPVGDDL